MNQTQEDDQIYLGQRSEPCCMRDPQLCQKQLWRLAKSDSNSSAGSLQGWGLNHSMGEILEHSRRSMFSVQFLFSWNQEIILHDYY